MALKKECPACKYRNSVSKRKCVKCGAPLTGRDVVYWVDLWLFGRRIRERVGPSRSAAQARELALKQKKARAKALDSEEIGLVMKLEDFWPRYAAWCRIHNRDFKNKLYRWKKHLGPFFGGYVLGEMDLRMVEAYRTKRLQAGARPATVNRELEILGHMMKMAVKWKLIEKNPLEGMGKLPEENDDRWRYLTEEEFSRLKAAINPEYRDFLVFLTFTGLRLGDALRLRWGDVDLEREVALIRGVRTKTGKSFGIPLHPLAVEILKHRLQSMNGTKPSPEDRIFRHSDAWFRRAFKRALEKAGLPKTIRIHDLRHTFASWLALKGVPIQQIQALLGHRQLTTTLRYAHLNPAILKEAVNKI